MECARHCLHQSNPSFRPLSHLGRASLSRAETEVSREGWESGYVVTKAKSLAGGGAVWCEKDAVVTGSVGTVATLLVHSCLDLGLERARARARAVFCRGQGFEREACQMHAPWFLWAAARSSKAVGRLAHAIVVGQARMGAAVPACRYNRNNNVGTNRNGAQ